MLRALSVLVVLAVSTPSAHVAAQDCRRNCKASEKPDANGCCKKVRKGARASGYVWVVSDPPGQRIRIDGRARGKTPALVKVGRGKHTVHAGDYSVGVDVKRDGVANAVFARRPPSKKNDESEESETVRRDPKGNRIRVTNARIEILDKIYFNADRHDIKAASNPILKAVAAALRNNPELWVEVQGHTDNRERAPHSVKRAEAVARFLISHGIAAHRLRITAWGETRPIASNARPESRARNRRVEFLVIR